MKKKLLFSYSKPPFHSGFFSKNDTFENRARLFLETLSMRQINVGGTLDWKVGGAQKLRSRVIMSSATLTAVISTAHSVQAFVLSWYKWFSTTATLQIILLFA